MQDRYLNPFTDFGFEKLFGSEPNKDLLLDFLNELIKEHGHIQYFKNLPMLRDRAKRIQERVFERLFDAAEISRFDPSEREAYEESIKVYRDLKNTMDTQWEEGHLKGKKEGKKERLRPLSRLVKISED